MPSSSSAKATTGPSTAIRDFSRPTGERRRAGGYLKERGCKRVFCAGLATDFCVAWTALDARAIGFDAVVIEDACRAIDSQGSLARALADMQAAGVSRVAAAGLLN